MRPYQSGLAAFCVLAAASCGENSGTPAPNPTTTTNSSSTAGGSTTQTATGGGSSQGGSSVVGGNGGTGGATTGTAGTSGAANGGTAGVGGAGGSGGTPGAGGMDAGSVADAGGPDGPLVQPFKCPAGPFPTPQAGGSTTLCATFKYNHLYNEGAAWIAGMNAFVFSNFVQGAAGGNTDGDIIKYTPGGGCEIFIANPGTNGLAVSPNGNIVGASHKTRSITEWDIVTKQPKILADMYMNRMLDSPNDLAVHSNGGIYFSNTTFELGGRPPGFGTAVFWRNPAGVLSVVAPGGGPNGVVLSQDQRRLYVVGGGVWDLDAAGTPSNNRAFTFPPTTDGLAVDCSGNVYTSSGSILSPAGAQIGTFPGGTNLAFGGADGMTLYVVGTGTGLHAVQMNLPGMP